MNAEELLAASRRALEPLERRILAHPYLTALERGDVPDESLRSFVGEQDRILRSDRRSFAFLAARFPEPPAGDLFLDLAHGEGVALGRLDALARSLGAEPAAHAADPRCQAYSAFVAWLALNGSRADAALGFLANLPAWGANCARMANALRDRADVSFFEFFAEPSPDFEQRALTVIEQGLAAGERPEQALEAAGRLQAYELMYWDAL